MNRTFKSNLCLLGTALIWGFALVAQRDSMSVMDPFMYSAIRMFLGSAALVPVYIIKLFVEYQNKIVKNLKKLQNKLIRQNDKICNMK